jgi:hypothetical protein
MSADFRIEQSFHDATQRRADIGDALQPLQFHRAVNQPNILFQIFDVPGGLPVSREASM